MRCVNRPCDTIENAQRFTESDTFDVIYFFSFVEEDEKAYWEKINADRVTRYSAKRGKKRGTEKVQTYA